jgi:hypothetical protein
MKVRSAAICIRAREGQAEFRPAVEPIGRDMEEGQLNWIANFIRGIADAVLRDLYVRGKYREQRQF